MRPPTSPCHLDHLGCLQIVAGHLSSARIHFITTSPPWVFWSGGHPSLLWSPWPRQDPSKPYDNTSGSIKTLPESTLVLQSHLLVFGVLHDVSIPSLRTSTVSPDALLSPSEKARTFSGLGGPLRRRGVCSGWTHPSSLTPFWRFWGFGVGFYCHLRSVLVSERLFFWSGDLLPLCGLLQPL